jgi:transposase
VFHRNARLTVHGRLLIVQRYQAGWRQAHIAAAMGVSRKCVKTWIDRHDSEGEAGLQTRSSRPHAMPTKTAPEVEQKVLDARAEHRDGPDVLGPRVGVPARTVSRILRRHRVPYLRQCDPMTGEVIRSSKASAVRYERDKPGQLVHISSATTTCTHWSMTTPASRTPRSCPTRRGRRVRRFCNAPRSTSPTRASPNIERVITDNAFAYRHSNDIKRVNSDRTDALAPWLEHYNTVRRHSALGGKPPISRL